MKNTKKNLDSHNEVEIEGKLNEVIITESIRSNGTLRIQQGFDFCPTLTEQHTAHLTDLNYLIERYKPDELAAYIAAKMSVRPEIIGHDFSQEPELTQAKNIVYQMKTAFDNLPDDVKMNFKNHVEFLKFIDNPANQEKMLKLGLMTKKEISRVATPTPTTTQEEAKEKAATE